MPRSDQEIGELLEHARRVCRRLAARYEFDPAHGNRISRYGELVDDIAQSAILAFTIRERTKGTVDDPQAFLAKVVHNEFMQHWRQEREVLEWKTHDDGTPNRRVHGATDRTEATPAKEDLRERAERLRRALDEIRWQDKTRVTYWAVLLFQLRYRALVGTRAALGKDTELWEPDELVELAERLVRWKDDEEELEFRREWPRILATWLELCHQARASRGALDANDICRTVDELRGVPRGLNRATWYKWVNRAKDRARERLAPRSWKEHFETLLPDHDVVGEPGSGGGE